MKKLILIASLAVAGSSAAFGQAVLIAGWDFEFTASNYAGLVPAGVLGANYSDSYIGADGINNPVNDGAASALRGTLYLNNTNGSDLWAIAAGPTASATKNTSTGDADFQILTRDGSATKLGGFGGLASAALGLNRTTASISEISFVLNTTDIVSLGNLVYRTRMTAGSGSIDWLLQVGANTFNLDPAIDSSGAVYGTKTVDLSAAVLGGATSVTLIGTIANSSTSNVLLLDNLGVYGTFEAAVIPEPTTYAALLGLVTLGIALVRRRRDLVTA